ncbi:MAG TPA: hypothetical protein VFQ76_18570 [Longimicrobiaceae bacterium]|nr:hypothetical protein [Longimicrobiaceae bacterium]
MEVPLDAFSVAAELLGDVPLTPGQLTQLRALDHRYYQELFDRLNPPVGPPRTRAELAEEEVAALRALLEAGVRDMLTPGQRRRLEGR